MSERAGYAFPWEHDAMRGAAMPEGLDLLNQKAFLAMRFLYRSYYAKMINREAAQREKRMIQAALAKEQEQAAFQDRICAHHVSVIRLTEAAVTACRKDPSPENAMRLCDVLDGLDRSDLKL